ncbi:SurA N-terminal domain-containing protein [Solimonas sp. SE-A11]|uniref:SurA N-terminal domain-containing protein n=1 Tax=Solimonas sp. SE-A11 TaxID=3054954 RepID=UPI00259C73FD|nr:SurA N-terminal domain-containing protein [Solimonas sp. SE-A11]MDM4768815.1 SurA N-terminal domain-containing protein [Solimonas sp. SE-A11]
MLQQIRDRTSGIVAGFIVALLVVPFAFFGIETFAGGGGDPVVAKVGKQKIHQSQFQNNYDQRYRQYVSLMGENFKPEEFKADSFRKLVLDDMTQEAMLRQFADQAGYRANDAVVFDYLSRIPAFQKEGKFDTETYRAVLARQGLDPVRFEEQVRNSIAIEQMRSGVLETAFITDADIQQAWRLAMQDRVVEYALFDNTKYLAQASVTEEQVKARYDQKKAQLMAPERIRLAYVELSQAKLAQASLPGQDVLKTIYDAEKASRFTTQEQRKASHILVNFGADKSAAKKKAEGLAAQLKGGADFAALARANSDDTGSKAQGGDLGWIKRGQMPESFEKELFDLKAGEVAGPIETEFGWQLIRLDDLKPSVTRALADADVQQELISLYQNRELAKRFQEQTEKLEQLAFESNASLDPVAKELGVQVQTTDWFTRDAGTGIAANPAVMQAAFSPEVREDNENSKPITVGESLVVVRKAEYEAPRQRPLAEVAESLREELRAEIAKAQAQADAKKLLAELRAGKPLVEAVIAAGAELRQPGAVKRVQQGEDPLLLQAVFKLPRPAAGKPQYSELSLVNGNVVVAVLTDVRDPTPATVQEVAQLRPRLREMQAGAEFTAYQKVIGEKVEIKLVNPPTAAASPEEE